LNKTPFFTVILPAGTVGGTVEKSIKKDNILPFFSLFFYLTHAQVELE